MLTAVAFERHLASGLVNKLAINKIETVLFEIYRALGLTPFIYYIL